ncbi:demethylmenaquinone methyltransferase family protein [Penicillium alfredii]|uniref:Demethylmenaquinone methyltransferase family protein n=1 Tax=Penicillium alfredii TaxID=1506179 RepID=A0A9W9F2F3_9EURO|nr:demethylmenaquinone methyltransferase family protein [Penicillium alfredii]KAJ5092316.1 demethylmenaquinone methyltransferase family protein [Penicillium alfredii]
MLGDVVYVVRSNRRSSTSPTIPTYGLQLWDCPKIVGRASTVKVSPKTDSAPTTRILTPRIEEVVVLGEQIDRRQTLMVQDIRSGKPVSEVMHDTQFEAIHQDSVSQAAAPCSNRNPKEASPEDQELVAPFADSDTPGITVGPAFTVRYVPASNPPGNVGDFIDDVAIGDIVVLDNSGRIDCTVWGSIMTQYAGLRDIAGCVIDGLCRDVTRAINDYYSIFTAGRWMRTGKDCVQVGGVDEPIGIGKVRVQPRDIVVADANGVVIVPRDRAREVAQVARNNGKMRMASAK